MTKDEIIRMAQESWVFPEAHIPNILEFANLIAAAEREACAKFIEQEYVRQFEEPWRENLAKTIRERGNND